MKNEKKFYVVWEGLKKGIFYDWDSCKSSIQGFQNAKYKSFPNLEKANEAYQQHYSKFINSKTSNSSKINTLLLSPKIIKESICIDGACNGTTGEFEYRGIYLKTRKIIFSRGPFKNGSNNIAEFLALVHALALCKNKQWNYVIYSDSKTALAWVRKKRINSEVLKNSKDEKLILLAQKAEDWLKTNTFSNTLLKWETELWGENPADYGRK